MEIMKFEYNGTAVEFEPKRSDVLVNSTQMAKIFGKESREFLSNQNTVDFIKAYCLTGNFPFDNEFSPSGKLVKVVKGGNNPGTWMDRKVALKFAAWLDPFFEVWIYDVIDELLFGEARKLHEGIIDSARRRARIDELRTQLNEDERYLELAALENEDKRLTKKRAVDSSRQLNLFKEQFLQEKLNK